MLKFVLCFAVSAISLSHVRAKISGETERILLKHLEGFVEVCRKELNLDVGPILWNEKHITADEMKAVDECFAACILKKGGLMNAEGKIDYDKEVDAMKKVIKNEDDIKILETDSKACLSVNDEEVSDGDKGCERAHKFVNCMTMQKK
ncbi:uncharacterized protein LOC113238269 [Hyposmocoma kahamanoa]|uniref:uncharacterized protein LOC113238269 n=1 Tax=Hyposmocoma kahamanoa TaxID=1477025 RepID=UPI000E6D9FE9|nr:uncharacterized protein LOC113238269 [Hyposmocoma kahamanoa]